MIRWNFRYTGFLVDWHKTCIHVSKLEVFSLISNFNQSDFQAKDLINQLLEDSTLPEDKRNGFKEKLKTIPESTQQNDSENRLENGIIFSPNSAYPSLRWLVLKFIIMYELISHRLERSLPWRKLRQVGCYDVGKFRLVTIDMVVHQFTIVYCLQIWTLLHHNTQPVLIFNRENLQNFESQNGPRR